MYGHSLSQTDHGQGDLRCLHFNAAALLFSSVKYNLNLYVSRMMYELQHFVSHQSIDKFASATVECKYIFQMPIRTVNI